MTCFCFLGARITAETSNMHSPGGGCGAYYLPLHLPHGGDIRTHTKTVASGVLHVQYT